MPITEILRENSRKYGDDIALIEVDAMSDSNNYLRKEITWREFDEKANKVANLLLSKGLKKGNKVAILMTNCLEWLPIYFGVLKTGALAVPLNFRYQSDEIEYCLALSDSDALIFGPEFVSKIQKKLGSIGNNRVLIYVGEDCPSFASDYYTEIENSSIEDLFIELTDNDDAAIYFSSGTTGFPKAILHNHQSLMHAGTQEQYIHEHTTKDRFLCIPPLYHTGAKMHWMGHFMVGSSAVILKGAKPATILNTMSREKCTVCFLLVPWAQDILDAIDRKEVDLQELDLSNWRLMHIGAQPVPQSLIKRWLSVFPKHQYDTTYGLSESCGPGALRLGLTNTHKVGAIGKAGYGWEVRLVNPEGQDVTASEVGEIILKGPGMMTCYYRDEKATKETIKDGWLYTGDMAKYDEDGFIYIVDRKKDVIISGGENIYPVQIEDFLRNNECIKDVAVIGMMDRRLGEIPAAIIEIREGMSLTEEEVNEFCKELPRYKRPKKIIFDKVPRNPTGKIEKPKLRELYGSQRLVGAQYNS